MGLPLRSAQKKSLAGYASLQRSITVWYRSMLHTVMQPSGLCLLHICFFDEPFNILFAFLHTKGNTGCKPDRGPVAIPHVVQDFLHTYVQAFVEFAGNFNEWHHGLRIFDLLKYNQFTLITPIFYQIIPIKFSSEHGLAGWAISER